MVAWNFGCSRNELGQVSGGAGPLRGREGREEAGSGPSNSPRLPGQILMAGLRLSRRTCTCPWLSVRVRTRKDPIGSRPPWPRCDHQSGLKPGRICRRQGSHSHSPATVLAGQGQCWASPRLCHRGELCAVAWSHKGTVYRILLNKPEGRGQPVSDPNSVRVVWKHHVSRKERQARRNQRSAGA